jgi:ATP-binding cassette subfamily C (CFTR/MRP) protein 1
LVLEAVAFLVLPLLTYLSHTRTRQSSTVALLFWLAYFPALLIWSRTVLLDVTRERILAVLEPRWGIGGLGIVAFALECLGPEFRAEPDDKPRLNPESPLLTANVFSVWTFGWLTPLMKKGVKQFITEDDLPELLSEEETAKVGQKLQRAMKKHKSLWTAFFASYGGPFALAACLKLLQDSLSFLQPQFLRLFLSFISSYQSARLSGISEHLAPSAVEGLSIATLMFSTAIVQSIILHQYFQRCFETGMRVRAGLVAVIYQKALVLSNDERGKASGDIVNLMSVDASRLQDLCTYGLMIISAPFQVTKNISLPPRENTFNLTTPHFLKKVTLAFVSLYNLLGWSAFVGVGIMIFSVPLNTMIANFLKNLQVKQMKSKDKRSRLMSELLANIKSIKLYAWEHAFLRRVLLVRNEEELKMLRKIGIYSVRVCPPTRPLLLKLELLEYRR